MPFPTARISRNPQAPEEEEAERQRARIKKLFGEIRRLHFNGATEAAEEIRLNRREI